MSVQFAKADPVPLEYFALRDAISNVSIAPDGKHLALMKIESREGNPIIEIYETDDLSKKPYRVGADPMEFTSLRWVNDYYIVFNARQKVRKRIDGFNRGVYEFRTAGFNINTKKFVKFGENTAIANVLPKEPDTILISVAKENAFSNDDDPFAAFRPRAYYRLNLKKGTTNLVMKGGGKVASASFDDDGNPRLAFGYDAGTREFIYYARNPGESNWREAFRQDGYSHENFNPVGFNQEQPNIAYVVANNGHDLAGLWTFDTNTGTFGDLLFRDQYADVATARKHSNYWGEGDKVSGAIYYGAKFETHWFDEEEHALWQQLEAVIPNAYQISVQSRSRDGSRMIAYNSGPHDPGSYYLVMDGSIQKIGGRYPLLKPEDLSDVRYIKYAARDGRTIPAYVTVPHGEGPFPLIVLPHGGPHVAEVVIYDEWGQMLANNGYMVLQPQYRGSLGYGIDHYIATWNEHGKKMQDDKDDGALYLVQQGMVDPDRMAMFGWSYGGYAAAVAAARTPQIYQCVIPGAAVTDPTMQFNYYRDQLRPFELEFEDQRRSGVSPLEEAPNVNVPMLLIHGDVDQRVPFEHFKKYKKALEANDKDVQYLVLKGADHFSNTLYFNHQLDLYTTMIDYLKNDCGPGGL
ncbi:MAG: alpha/beta hydrolase family protein [bacterium]